MTVTYHCPDCNRLHDEPAHAAFRLFVLCFDCETERERGDVRSAARDEPARRAA